MNQNLTEIVFILDKSGSMWGLEEDTIGGFNSLIEKQKKEAGDCLVTCVLFCDYSTKIYDRTNIKEIKKLTNKEYFVEGSTALLDAIGNTLNYINNEHKKLKDEFVPYKTLFVITTDGMENSSTEYTYKKVKALIDKCKEDKKYEFIFLGANIDSQAEAEKLGIDKDSAVDYRCDGKGIEVCYESVCECVSNIRKKNNNKAWRDKIDKDYKSRN